MLLKMHAEIFSFINLDQILPYFSSAAQIRTKSNTNGFHAVFACGVQGSAESLTSIFFIKAN